MVSNNSNERVEKISAALALAIEDACGKLDFDLRCLDWFSYTPDFFIEQKNKKVA